MTLLMTDDLVARLAAYQDRLDAAREEQPASGADPFDHPPAGIGCHEIDTETRVLRVNDEELRLLGYGRDEMVGRRVVELIVMNETAERAIARKISGELELKPFVRTFRRKDGSAVALVLLDRHLKDASGRVVGLRTVMTKAGGPAGG